MDTWQTNRTALLLSLCLILASAAGCHSRTGGKFKASVDEDCYRAIASQVEYPQVSQCSTFEDDWASVEPLSLSSTVDPEYWDVPLEEVVQLSLSHSKILRNLGGILLNSPSSVATHWDTAIQETDPRFGIDAALSAFDAQYTTGIFGEKNDRALNNEFFGGGTRLLQQDTLVYQSELTKRAVTGTQLTFRHNVDYDSNNAPGNIFRSAWNVNLETEFRHPLLQGNGIQFNRIAGPSNVPGIYSGVLIARINTDVELAEFEIAVRDHVSNIENAYWDLYYAYRDLDAKVAARDATLDTWRRVHALFKVGRRGGEAEKEAQAREQFYRFQEEVQNALSGRRIDGTRTGNGSDGGTFRANGGVHVAERQLRRLMGLPPSDGRLLRPADEPINASVQFDWHEITRESVLRRAELRRQRFETRRNELEWIASKNHLLPRLDAIGRYRWRGFGDGLINSSGNNPRFDNAYEDLTSGDFQEWQVGLELSVPIGYRRAFSAARNAELQLSRARAILREQEHQVLHDLAAAVGEVDRAYVVSQTTFNRLEAARNQMEASTAAFEADKAPLDLLLDSQRRLADAKSRHFRSMAEYAIAIKNVHYAKGTLLDYDGVYLSEGGWPRQAYRDAATRENLRGKPMSLNYAASRPPRISRGQYSQHSDRQQSDQQIPAAKPTPIPLEAPIHNNAKQLETPPLPTDSTVLGDGVSVAYSSATDSPMAAAKAVRQTQHYTSELLPLPAAAGATQKLHESGR